jgi:F-type H+-transporting ATPase subunit b
MNFLAFAESIQLVPDGTLFIHIAIIIVMVFVLNRLLFKPVIGLLEERERQTHGRSDEAHQTLKRVDEELARYERTMRDARAEGYKLLEQAQREAAAEREGRIGQVRAEVEQVLNQEKQVIRAQAAEAKANLEAEARRMATTVSSQILGRSI